MYVRARTWLDDGPPVPRSGMPCVRATGYARARKRSRGFGAYPDSACFDPTRPSILPFWFDDFTEAACWDNLALYGNPTGNTTQAGQPGADPATVANAKAYCASSGGSWDPSTQVCTPAAGPQTWLPYLPWALGGLAALLVLPRIIGGGR